MSELIAETTEEVVDTAICLHKITVNGQDILDNSPRLAVRCQLCNEKLWAYLTPRGAKTLAEVDGILIAKAQETRPNAITKSTKNPSRLPTTEETLAEREKVTSGPGTEGLRMFHLMGFGWCSECNRLADIMDTWGVEGCREPDNFSYIMVDAFKPNPKTGKSRVEDRWEELKARAAASGGNALSFWWKAWGDAPIGAYESSMVAKAFASSEKEGLRKAVEYLFKHAIDVAEEKEKQKEADYEEALAKEALAAQPET